MMRLVALSQGLHVRACYALFLSCAKGLTNPLAYLEIPSETTEANSYVRSLMLN